MDNYNFSLTLEQIAEITKSNLIGDKNIEVKRISTLKKANANEISFFGNSRYLEDLRNTNAAAVIIDEKYVDECKTNSIVNSDPKLALAYLVNFIDSKINIKKSGIHETAVIGENSEIHPSVSIEPHVTIGKNVTIGENTVIMSNAVIHDGVKIGSNCRISNGAVIGNHGFGFANDKGRWIRLPHLGSVTIGNNVEIGSNTTIDRGALEDTIIEDNVIIDNLVQIAHNVVIGKSTAIAGCVGIAGSAKIGSNCLIGGGSGISGHIEITDGVHITAKSGVNSSIKKPGIYSSGLPVKPNTQWRRNVACFNNLNDFFKRLKKLELEQEQ